MLRRYEAEGAPFAERYWAMLAAGVSMPADAIVAQVGLNVNDPGFWSTGMDHLEALVEHLSTLG